MTTSKETSNMLLYYTKSSIAKQQHEIVRDLKLLSNDKNKINDDKNLESIQFNSYSKTGVKNSPGKTAYGQRILHCR